MRKASSIDETVSLPDAASEVWRSRDTVLRWCKQHQIGRQLSRGAPWRVFRVALLAVAAGDFDGLEAFHAGDPNSPLLDPYIRNAEDPEALILAFTAALRRGDVKALAANASPELTSILRQALGQAEK